VGLLSVNEPAPSEAANGQILDNFDISAAADPPANFSSKANAFRSADALYVQKLEFFHSAGTVAPVTLTRGSGGTAVVHIWTRQPLFQFVSTKCEFARTVRFSVPTALLVGIERIDLINHDTGAKQALFESVELANLLRGPQLASATAVWQGPLPASGNGCGA
jgi:hypothetical protein